MGGCGGGRVDGWQDRDVREMTAVWWGLLGQEVLSGEGTGPLLKWSSLASPAAPTPLATLLGTQLTSVDIMAPLSRVRSFTKRTLLGFCTKGSSITVARPMNLGR